MGVLATYLRTKADDMQKEKTQRSEAIWEWIDSIDKLYSQLRTWLETADNGLGLIRNHVRDQVLINESRLGRYWCQKLTIFIGEDTAGWIPVVEVVPRARYVAAKITIEQLAAEPFQVEGEVDIREGAEILLRLYRIVNSGNDIWCYQTEKNWSAGDTATSPKVLTSEVFESTVLSALK